MLKPVPLIAAVVVGLSWLGGCDVATASERPTPATATAVAVALPPAPQIDQTVAPAPIFVTSRAPATLSSRLAGELRVRAEEVAKQLRAQSLSVADVRVPADGLQQLQLGMHRHGVLASAQNDPRVPVMDCEISGGPGVRASCWIDALVWAQSVIVDGAGLGARSQPLPPHRKRLSRKERDAVAADAVRRRVRAVKFVYEAIVANTSAAGVMDGWLREVGPGRWSVYKGLVVALSRYRKLATQVIPEIPTDLPLATKHAYRRRKERREWLAKLLPRHRDALRTRLCAEGYCAPPPAVALEVAVATDENIAVENTAKKFAKRRRKARRPPPNPLNEALSKRLAEWQSHRGLRASGLVNKDTAAQLRVPMSARVQQIRLALQRIRDTEVGASDDFLIANIPSFRLDIWRDRKHTTSHLTQVGKGIKRVRRKVRGRKRWLWVPGMRTPMISTKLGFMVVNPEWVVPSSIRREYRWKIANDENWLADNGFEMRPASNGGNYMVMKSGPTNLLGQVKFMFPNTHLVYLHDTLKKRGFKHPVRTRSHGCVRVERAFELARSLLSADTGKPWTEKKWAKYLEKHSDKWLKLRKKVDLHIAYWTADVTDDGTPRFYRDVYHYDRVDLQRVADVAAAMLPEELRAPMKSIPAGPSTPQSPGNK